VADCHDLFGFSLLRHTFVTLTGVAYKQVRQVRHPQKRIFRFRPKNALKKVDRSIDVDDRSVPHRHSICQSRIYDLREGDTKIIRNLLAYRKVDVEKETEEFWVPPTVFDKEFVVGVNKAELVKELHRLGWLAPAAYDGNPIFS
jgi:hypothetical protein